MKIEKACLVPHFHFDFEWWKEEPHHEEDALIIIRKGLDLLREFPHFTFVIDTALPLKYFLDRNSAAVGEVKRYVAEGRLELVGGGLVSPDEGLPTGEGLIRQFAEGKRWYEETLGLDVRVAWEIDEFSHPAQMPQIMGMLGLDYFVFSRGVHPYDAMHPTLFRWVSPRDGAEVTAYWWAAHYICSEPASRSREKNLKRFFKEMRVRIPFEGARSPVPYLMIPLGGDFSIPSADWIEFVDRWNRTESPPLEFSTPSAFFGLVDRHALPVVRGEFAPIYSGYFTSRHRLKRRCRQLEYGLSSAEKALSLCHALGAGYPHEQVRRAWWEVLKSDFHDTICGTGTDRVFRKSLERYDRAERIVEECLKQVDRFVGERLSGAGHYVFNPCNWERREVATVGGVERLVTAPPLAVSRIDTESAASPAAVIGPARIENEHLLVEIDEKTGAVRIRDKDRRRDLFGPNGNRIIVEDDIGNLWASMPTGRVHPIRVTNIAAGGEGGPTAYIAVTLANRIAEITKRITLPPDKKEARVTIDVDFRGKDKRIVETFPFSFPGRLLGEEPFYAAAKPDGTWPLQNGALYDGGDYRAAVINRGIPGHVVSGGTLGMVLMRSVSMMSLLWVGWLIRNITTAWPLLMKAARLYRSGFNTFEFPLYPIHHVALRDFASEGSAEGFAALDPVQHIRAKLAFTRESRAWERGRHRFEYAILPDVSGVGEMTRRGFEFNNPLIVRQFSGTGSRRRAAFIDTDTGRAIVTAIRPYRDGLMVRCYETEGEGGAVRFSLHTPVRRVSRMETLGGDPAELPCSRGSFTYDLAAHEIASFYLEP